MSTTEFEGQTFLVVGGTGGIGSEVARRLVDAGANVGLFARTEPRLAELAGALGPRASCHVGDTLDAEALAAAVDRLTAAHGRVDGLVHAVGSILLRPLHLTKAEDFTQAWRLNTLGPFLAIKAVLPGMLEAKRGSVVCCSSIAGGSGLPNHEAIASAKGGLEGLLRSAAMTYAPAGIRFNAVAPGLVRTPLAKAMTSSEAALKASVAMHPVGRIGEPDEVAAAIVYLLGAAWTTGVVLPVDGGMAAGRSRP